jgi:hypothetical protein
MDSVTGTASCCRLWAVLLYTRIGRCGVCGERPRLVAAEPPWPPSDAATDATSDVTDELTDATTDAA